MFLLPTITPKTGCLKSHEMAAWVSLVLRRIYVGFWGGRSVNGPLLQSLLSPDLIYSPKR